MATRLSVYGVWQKEQRMFMCGSPLLKIDLQLNLAKAAPFGGASQGSLVTLFLEGLYTDFRTGAQLLLVLIECLMDVHACIFVETQGARQVLRVDA